MVKPRQQNPIPPESALRVPRRSTWKLYQPASEMRRPLHLFRSMWADLLGSRDLAWQLAKRDLSAQYRESFLGFAWAIIPPVVVAAGLSFAASAKVLNIGATDIPYPAYVLFSTALWQTFVESLTLPMQRVAAARMMLSKIQFPREAIIASALTQVFFTFGFKLLLIIGMFMWFRLSVPLSVVIAPVALLHMIVMGTALGMLLAPLNALYQDFQRGIQVLTTIWLLLTPVIYPPPTGDGIFGLLVRLNPVSPLLVTTRELATTGVVSDPQGFWVSSAIAFIGLPISWLIFRLAMPYAIERFSS